MLPCEHGMYLMREVDQQFWFTELPTTLSLGISLFFLFSCFLVSILQMTISHLFFSPQTLPSCLSLLFLLDKLFLFLIFCWQNQFKKEISLIFTTQGTNLFIFIQTILLHLILRLRCLHSESERVRERWFSFCYSLQNSTQSDFQHCPHPHPQLFQCLLFSVSCSLVNLLQVVNFHLQPGWGWSLIATWRKKWTSNCFIPLQTPTLMAP